MTEIKNTTELLNKIKEKLNFASERLEAACEEVSPARDRLLGMLEKSENAETAPDVMSEVSDASAELDSGLLAVLEGRKAVLEAIVFMLEHDVQSGEEE